MNPNLLHAVRERMRERSNDELIALWVTNDRAMYSPEAFEAVKSLLAERGVTHLPPQSDPAPIADKHKPAADPAAQYWLGWLKPLLWMGIVLALLRLGQRPGAAWVAWPEIKAAGFGLDQPWLLAVGVLDDLLLPILFVVAAVAALWLRAWARRLLLAWAVAVIVLGAATAALSAGREITYYDRFDWAILRASHTLSSYVSSIVLPVLTFVLLRRPEMRALFEQPTSGFEPLTDPTDASPTAPAGTPPNPASPAGSSSPEAQC